LGVILTAMPALQLKQKRHGGVARGPSHPALGFGQCPFPAGVHQVDILKIGRSRLIVPQGRRWDDLFQQGPRPSDDFMAEREQPQAEEREPL